MTIPVLFCIDGNYWQHLGVSISSLCKSNPKANFRIFLVSASEMDPGQLARVRSVIPVAQGTLETIVYREAAKYEHFPTHSHLTFAMYLRLFMTEYIDPTLDKLLYLDSDIIICSAIDELWSIPLADAYIGAAPEPYDERQRAPLDFSSTDLYINSGVMLVNLAKWRRENALARLLAFAQANQHALIFSPDQDLINCVFRGHILNIGYRWNWQALFPRVTPSELGLSESTFESLKHSPPLIHFTSPYKPWFYRWEPHYKERYYQVLAGTPWADYQPPDRQWKNFPLHIVRILQRHLEWYLPAVARTLREIKGSSSKTAA